MPDQETKQESNLSEEESQQVKQHIHAGLSTSITFAEVVQIINSMLVKEVEERVSAMSEDELQKVLEDVKNLSEGSEGSE